MGSCEHGSRPSGYIKGCQCLDQLSTCQLPEDDSAVLHGVIFVTNSKKHRMNITMYFCNSIMCRDPSEGTSYVDTDNKCNY